MKNTKFIGTIIFVILVFQTQAQDTLIIDNNYKWKIGAKFIAERSNDYSYSFANSYVTSGGIQLIYKIYKTKSNIESGLYIYKKANIYQYSVNQNPLVTFPVNVKYSFVSIPLLYKFDTKSIYVSAGISLDYLINTTSDNSLFFEKLPYYGTDRPFQISVGGSIGIEKSINNNTNLFFEGRGFTNITSSKLEHDLFQASFTNLGIGIGINLKFNKE